MRISDTSPKKILSQKHRETEKISINFRIRYLTLGLILFLIVFSSCSGLEKFDKHKLTIESKGGLQTLTVELARTDAQRSQGLMHRKTMKDGEGMLFIFERDQMFSFWMKNTLIPLSIAYIASDGKIFEIYDMEPGNLSSVASSRSGRYALEVPQGWFKRAGIGVGDRVDLAGL